jgi:hypothetical protein
MVVEYSVPDDVRKLVLLNRWKSVVCAGCFDLLAEEEADLEFSFDHLGPLAGQIASASAGTDVVRKISELAPRALDGAGDCRGCGLRGAADQDGL